MMALLAQPILSTHTWDLIMKELSPTELAAAAHGRDPPRLGGGGRDGPHPQGGSKLYHESMANAPEEHDLSVGNVRGEAKDEVARGLHDIIQAKRNQEDFHNMPTGDTWASSPPSEAFSPHQPPRGTRVIPEWQRENLMGQAGPAHEMPTLGEEEQIYPEGRVPEVPHQIKQILEQFPEGDPNTPIEVQQLRALLGQREKQKVGVTTAPGQTMAAKVGVTGNLFPGARAPDAQGRGN
tara:strand:+ start:8113 stop:8823 length:711 start_codon:yes stop_codon:yes gene_type:complete